MEVSLAAHEVSDICIGKPALRSLSISATVGDALTALKRSRELYISVWNCEHRQLSEAGADGNFSGEKCRCVGKVCMVDIISFLCKEENLSNPGSAFQAPVSILLPRVPGLVKHLEPKSSLVEAIDLILEGAQNLVIPLESGKSNTRKKILQKNVSNSCIHDNSQYCWLTQEDIIRYLLNWIGLFSPTSVNPINTLSIIDVENILAVHYDDPASSTLPYITKSLEMQTSVAITDGAGKLIGEISPFTLNACDEDVAAAVATLTSGDLMAYIDCGGPPEYLVQLVKERLQERKLENALELMEEDLGISSGSSFSSLSSFSSDDEFGVERSGKLGGYSARVVRRSEAIVCYPWSSLVAVMIRALAHRVSYVWVVEEDGTLTGIVTFTGMLKVFREHLRSMGHGLGHKL